MPKRDPQATRSKILAAAVQSFSEAGIEGTRIDAVARRSGANKRMIYHYFGDKAGLFEAVVEARLESRPWSALAAPNATDARLMAWEGLHRGAATTSTARQRALDAMREALEERRQHGLLPKGLNVQQLALVLLSARLLPHICPQYIGLLGVDAAQLEVTQASFLEQLLDALKPGSGAAPKPRVKLKPRISG
jgi:AcrR family transcriptional regulator